MSDWTAEGELEKAQQRLEKAKQRLEEYLQQEKSDPGQVERLQESLDVAEVQVRTWQTIIKNQTFKTPPPDFDLEGLRELKAESAEAIARTDLLLERIREYNAKLAERMRQFKERSEESQKKWDEEDAKWKEDQAKRKKEKDADQPPQEPELG